MRRAPLLLSCGTALAWSGLLTAALNSLVLPRPRRPVAPVQHPVTVCVPARNEAARLPQLLADLRAQQHVPRLRVLVLDDDSTDGTSAAATIAAGGDERVSVHRRTDGPPPGWLGKSAACHRLAELALAEPAHRPEVLVFVDADVRLAPDAVAAGVALLHDTGTALVCPWPVQVAETAAERLVQPLQQWSWLSTLPLPVALRSHRPSMAAVCGQLLVVDTAAYAAVGGHSAVAGAVLEDLELARALRRHGYRTTPADGSELASCRMYTSAAELRAGYGKSLWTAFGTPVTAVALFAVLGAAYVLPPAAAVLGRGATRRWGVAGYLAAVGSRVIAARVGGSRAWPDALTQPLGVLALAGMTAASHRDHRRGRLSWKNRYLA
ncbi:glycosyltransferase family 2 protein [Rhodococcus sp. X156]|uniref:glycosyltransferase n=1 Tax=Rhodococcus sp. X156 TaxID=2499145 RepID=UPI000FD7EB61|nr:glycosyltransferase family 2 protein [Rhodococcus sp. X156]